jgi:CysZ protein
VRTHGPTDPADRSLPLGWVRQFFTGAGLLARGLGMYARSPGLLALGLIPAVISAALFLTAFGTLLYFVSDLADALTGFADDWSSAWRDVVQFLAAAGIVGLAAVLTVLLFTAVTLLIGDPFYEKISETVDDRCGGVPGGAVDVSFWQSLRRNLVDSLRLVALSALVGVPLFAAGFIPLVGQTVVPVVGATVAGWWLALELVGVPFARRGMRLADRRRALGAHRPLALGFGVAVFLCFLIPLGAVLVMPAAVAGATLLTRQVHGQAT